MPCGKCWRSSNTFPTAHGRRPWRGRSATGSPTLKWFRADPDDPEYGVTPLHYAPTPDSPWRPLFDDNTIDGHLDRMLRDQEADGGWGITWEPPGLAPTLAWRGIETLRALRTLTAYGRKLCCPGTLVCVTTRSDDLDG